jgi:glycosyltransferase involved in cell wall biosynthesis
MSSSLRILHVVPYYEQAWAYGGIPRLATAMARGLSRRGHAVTVCTTDACDATSRVSAVSAGSDAGEPDVRVFPNVSNRLAYRWQFFTPRGLTRHLRVRAHQFDVAHLHACRNLPGVIASHALWRARVPYVISPNGTAPALERRILAKRFFDTMIGRHVLTRAARVVATTDAERRQLRALGIEDSRIVVVPNPIDGREFHGERNAAAFRAAHGLGDAPLILFLGKLTPRKGVDVLVRAFHALGRPDVRLVIAGNDMGSGASADALAAALGVGDRMRRVGLLRGLQRLEALAAADVVVYPSRDEVFGLVAAEALLCGTPVVVCNDSGCGEIIGHVGGGHIVPYGDPETLAGAIASILDAPELWRQRARAAAARIRERFDAGVVCQQLESVYRSVLGSAGRSRIA